MTALLSLLMMIVPIACRAGQDAEVGVVKVRQDARPGFSQIVVDGEHGNLVMFVRDGEEITAIVDDAVVPPERIVREDDHVRILSPEGETLFDVRVVAPGRLYVGSEGRFAGAPGQGTAFWGDGPDVAWVMSRKLIGVTTTPVDAALAAQLDVDPEAAFIINQVSEGMPAQEAGVRPWDVVVAIDGEPPGTVARLREVLADKDEGETVKLSILRGGEPVELDVGFTHQSRGTGPSGLALDAARNVFNVARQVDSGAVRNALQSALERREAEMQEQKTRLEEARERLEERVVELREAEEAAREASGDAGADEARLKSLRAEVERAQAEFAAASEHLQASRLGAGFLDLGDDGGRALFLPPEYRDLDHVLPSPDDQQRLDRLEEHLRKLDAQMEERMARLEALINKLVESEKEP